MPSFHQELAKICRDVRAGEAAEGRVIDFRESGGQVWGLTKVDWNLPLSGSVRVNCVCPRATKTAQDIIEDADALMVNGVHEGFRHAWQNIRDGVLQVEGPLVLVGHSLGGAIVTQAALELTAHAEILEVVTFGCPRVGDAAFCVEYAPFVARTTRYVHNLDPVPWVPFWGWGYRHVRQARWWNGAEWRDGLHWWTALRQWWKSRESLKELEFEHAIDNYIGDLGG